MTADDVRRELARALMRDGNSVRFGPAGYELDETLSVVDRIAREAAGKAWMEAVWLATVHDGQRLIHELRARAADGGDRGDNTAREVRTVDSAWRCEACGDRFTSNRLRMEHDCPVPADRGDNTARCQTLSLCVNALGRHDRRCPAHVPVPAADGGQRHE